MSTTITSRSPAIDYPLGLYSQMTYFGERRGWIDRPLAVNQRCRCAVPIGANRGRSRTCPSVYHELISPGGRSDIVSHSLSYLAYIRRPTDQFWQVACSTVASQKNTVTYCAWWPLLTSPFTTRCLSSRARRRCTRTETPHDPNRLFNVFSGLGSIVLEFVSPPTPKPLLRPGSAALTTNAKDL